MEINWDEYRPSVSGCTPCECVDSLIEKGKQLQSRVEELEKIRNLDAFNISSLEVYIKDMEEELKGEQE